MLGVAIQRGIQVHFYLRLRRGGGCHEFEVLVCLYICLAFSLVAPISMLFLFYTNSKAQVNYKLLGDVSSNNCALLPS